MKTERSIFIAFILNLLFSIFEFFGGLFTGSIAIISDSFHDFGDAISIGIAFIFEKKSKKLPDEKYTYGYSGHSVIGGLITTTVLLLGCGAIIYNSAMRIIAPVKINYDGMIIFAIVGICINICASLLTQNGESVNQKAVNLHMLEDALGWIAVLFGAIIMRFTDFYIVDPLISICVAIFIFINAARNLKQILGLFLQRTPDTVNIGELKKHLLEVNGVLDVHHVHVWSIDGYNNFATLHVVVNGAHHELKNTIRKELSEHGIHHSTLELEFEGEVCHSLCCHIAERGVRS